VIEIPMSTIGTIIKCGICAKICATSNGFVRIEDVKQFICRNCALSDNPNDKHLYYTFPPNKNKIVATTWYSVVCYSSIKAA